VPTGWTVTDGTVDVANGGFCQSGQCVDLDGSSRDAGVLSRSFSLAAGVLYTLSSFSNAGGDNIGTLLDNVVINSTPVPEPRTSVVIT